MILGFDIGNTNTQIGIYLKDDILPAAKYTYKTVPNGRIETLKKNIKNSLTKYDAAFTGSAITGCIYSSVVPSINEQYDTIIPELFSVSPYRISSKSTLSISIKYNPVEHLGTDRIVNAEAAYREYGGQIIIVDIGTATNFCVILQDGTFDGGLIAPGIGITIQSLARRTSQLPLFEFGPPDRLIARDTLNALKAGFYYGWTSLIEGLVQKIENHYQKDFTVIITGGGSKGVHEAINIKSLYDPNLIMKGIRYIYNANNN